MNIELQPFTTGDYARLISWITSPEALLQWAGDAFTYPLTAEQLDHHLALTQNGRRSIYKAVDTASGDIVGHVDLSDIDTNQRRARVTRLLLGDVACRGQGTGSQIVLATLAPAFAKMGLHRVGLFVFEFNVTAIRLYERLGFVHEGILVEARRLGDNFWNVYVLAILADNWRQRYASQRST